MKKHFPNATLNTLAGPGPPPHGRGPMIFYGQNAIFLNYFFNLRLISIEIWPKHA